MTRHRGRVPLHHRTSTRERRQVLAGRAARSKAEAEAARQAGHADAKFKRMQQRAAVFPDGIVVAGSGKRPGECFIVREGTLEPASGEEFRAARKEGRLLGISNFHNLFTAAQSLIASGEVGRIAKCKKPAGKGEIRFELDPKNPKKIILLREQQK